MVLGNTQEKTQEEENDELQEANPAPGVNEDVDPDLTLTPREEAIARGDDPDKAVEASERLQEAASDDLEEEASYEGGDDQEATEDDQEPQEASKEDKPWITDDIRGFATQYGLGESDLNQFQTFDQFNAMTQVAQKLYEHETPASKEAEPVVEAKAEEGKEENLLDPEEYRKADFNEETVAVVEAVRGMQEREKVRDEQLTKREVELDGMIKGMEQEKLYAQANEYHDILDKSRPDFYGNTIDQKGNHVNLDKELAGRRQKIFKAIEKIAQYHADVNQSNGAPGMVPNKEILVQEAEQLVFGEELKKRETRSKGQRLRQQSNRRRGVGAARQVEASREPLNDNDEAAMLASDPDINKLWNDLQRASGTN